MTDIVDRLYASDDASALTNEAAREIERLRSIIDVAAWCCDNCGKPITHEGAAFDDYKGLFCSERCKADFQGEVGGEGDG